MSEVVLAPFPYFGGKASIAGEVWSAIGNDVAHYIEPFFGSGAVLLSRPGLDGSQTETVNDADGHLANVWRSLQKSPDEVARWCDWPVNHLDLIARKKPLVAEAEGLALRLAEDAEYCEPKLAGYWIWAASCWIGAGLTRPGQIAHMSDAGKGVHAKGKIPHVSNAGKGVHAKGKIPHVSDAGKGVHAKGKIPHVSDAGMGVQDIYSPSIYEWFRKLSERLRRVRVVCGDWTRVCGGNWQSKMGVCGMFFDPPYGHEADRCKDIYAKDCLDVAGKVRDWCRERGKDRKYRIVLAGYYDEHKSLLADGWTVRKWTAQGGYANAQRIEGSKAKGKANRSKEALFFSPHCLRDEGTLFDLNESEES